MTAPTTPRSASAQRVLDAALELFAESGFEGTSLQAIADRLGVTKAAVYYHFRTKDDLLVALVEPAFDELLARLDEAAALPRDGARQRRAVEVYVDHLLHRRRLSAWFASDAVALSRPAVWPRVQLVGRRLDELLAAGADDPLGALWSAAIVRAVIGAVLSAPEAPEEWVRARVVELADSLVAGYRSARRRQAAAEG